MADLDKKKRELKNVKKEKVIEAFEYIDNQNVPNRNQAKKYFVEYKNKEYPVKYLLAVAKYLQDGSEIEMDYFTSEYAREVLMGLEFAVKSIDDFKLIITKDDIVSSDPYFTMDNLGMGDNYEPRGVYLERIDGSVVYRTRKKREEWISNQTMPRLVFQCFENDINALSEKERLEFPTCRYTLNGYVYKGIYASAEDYKIKTNSASARTTTTYTRTNGGYYVIYGWNIFSTIIFVQECLKRFGKEDKIVFFYRPKEKNDTSKTEVEESTPPKEEPSNDKENKDKKPNFPLNQILYGPPGTGKTYNSVIYAVAICDADAYIEKEKTPFDVLKDKLKNNETTYEEVLKRYKDLQAQEGRIEFITFHQSYGYEEFIQGIKPSVNNNGQVVYNVENGIFKAFCDKAKDKKNNYVFIIDEINRGNVSKIFGELITLIEEGKRISAEDSNQGMTVKLPYKGEEFGVPDNVYILGTMNTADRSLVQLDAALRRRFRFIEMMPDYTLLETDAEKINVQNLLKEINKKIREKVDREHQIGHSYFIGIKKEAELKAVFKNEIIPLLQEYFYEDYDNIKAVLDGQNFMNENGDICLDDIDFKTMYSGKVDKQEALNPTENNG